MKLKEAEFKKSQKNSKKDSKKASTKTKSSSNNKSQHRIDKESAGIQDFDEGDRLLKEVLELGGSKEDLALIDNADSDSEQSELELGSKSVDSGLDADVESFIAGLGLDVNDTLPKTPCERPKETNKRKDDDHDKNKSTQAKEDLNKSRHKDPEDFASKSKAGTRDRSKPNGTTAEGDSSSRATKIKFSEDGEGTIAVSHSLLILEPRTAWYDPELEPPVAPKGELSPRTIEELHEQAKALLNKENDLYVHENAKSGSQKQFLSQLLSAGTLSDKISALTLLIQESPLHSVRYFETMLGLCKKKSKGSALQGVAALKDVFVGGVLPDRKLKWFKNQPLSTEIPASWLIIWAFEDWLKHFFFSLLQILEVSCPVVP
jgi:ribosome biogenesis protein MAK21